MKFRYDKITLAILSSIIVWNYIQCNIPAQVSNNINDKWTFNGESSDLVQHYLRLHRRGLNTTLNFQEDKLPTDVIDRLDENNLIWDELPGLMKRALLWDTGYVFNAAETKLLQVQVTCDKGTTMADIQQTKQNILEAKEDTCTLTQCISQEPNSIESFRMYEGCSKDDAMPSYKCMITSSDPNGLDSSSWATGGNPNLIPDPHVIPHIWEQYDLNVSDVPSIHAVHSIHMRQEPIPLGVCPITKGGEMVIPCVANNPKAGITNTQRYCRPEIGKLMNSWLEYHPIPQDLKDKDDEDEGEFSALSLAKMLALNDKWIFDGESSDLVQQYLQLYRRGVELQPSRMSFIPYDIQTRLETHNLDFTKLPSLMQRALLWDSGYVYASDGTTLQPVQVECKGNKGLTMADIQLTRDEYFKLKQGSSCTTTVCEGTNKGYYRAATCYEDAVLPKTKCLIETNATLDSATPMWANGGSADLIPDPHMRVHFWTEHGGGDYDQLIHTIDMSRAQTRWGECEPTGDGSMIIPCTPKNSFYSRTDISREFCRPMYSTTMATWLAHHPIDQDLKPSTMINGIKTMILGIALTTFVAGMLAAMIICFKCIHSKQNVSYDEYRKNLHEMLMTPNGDFNSDLRNTNASYNPSNKSHPKSSPSFFNPKMSPDEVQMGRSQLMWSLESDQMLLAHRISMEEILVCKVLSKGAYGEVCLCVYGVQDVAVKCLLPSKRTVPNIKEFVMEIKLTMMLDHPNIIHCYGVAWSCPENICMVMENCENGELYELLRRKSGYLSWVREKLYMAIGIAEAVAYLHELDPPIIHRDLKTRNVLLTAQYDVKLIDFGISRKQIDETMTAGVGTPYWTAPEVLDSKRYDEKSDIYSFGIFLSELDTGLVPYHDVLAENGERMAPLRILQRVLSGKLSPSFTIECPPRIRYVAEQCLKLNPAERPTAREVVEMLQGSRASAYGISRYNDVKRDSGSEPTSEEF